ERVFGVDERAGAALALGLGDDLQRQRGLARRLRTVNLDDATARQPTDAKRDVERERTGRDDLDIAHDAPVAHAHDRALAELLLDLGQRGAERLAFVVVHSVLPRLSSDYRT